MVLAAGTAMGIALVGTPLFMNWLRARGIGQQILEELGQAGHHVKAGTPTMGGVMMVIAGIGGYLVAHVRAGAYFSRGGLLVIGIVAAGGFVGLIDDWIKVSRRRSLGLTSSAKFGGLAVVAGAFAWLALTWSNARTELSFTRFDSLPIDLGAVGWIAFAMLVVLATTNGVNLADGLDGLAAGASLFAFSALAIIGFWQFRHVDTYEVRQALDFALAAAAMAGACTGFLWWNAAPARIQMGDTGALALGAGIAGLALVMNLHLLLPIIGGLFVIETLSVMVQVGTFKAYKRLGRTPRRVFRMAPLHHHFELLGWPETTVVIRFWILAGMCTAFSLAVFYADFLSTGAID